MKRLIIISLLLFTSSIFADVSIGVRIQAPIGNNAVADIGFRSDNHRYDNRYKNFDYRRNGYYDDFGYFYGYFDNQGYFFNNIFFVYNSKYTYRDRLNHKGYFSPKHVHYRPYKYHKVNDWNKSRNYRNPNQAIYGPYYDKKQNKSNSRYNERSSNRKNPSSGNKNYKKDENRRR